MYRLRVKKGRKWLVGHNEYSLENAIARQNELSALGIVTKIESASKVFDSSVMYK